MKKTVASLTKRRVNRLPLLVIEDNPDQWLIIRAALTQCFPEVEPIWTNHPAQALAYLESCLTPVGKLPLLVLLDLYLPRREDGWGVLASIRADPRFHQLPIVIMSVSQEPDDMVQSYSLGASAYQLKPATYPQWLTHFYSFRKYWWETVALPASR